MSKIPTQEEADKESEKLYKEGVLSNYGEESAFDLGVDWTIEQIKPEWRADDPCKHGASNRRVLCSYKTFKGVMSAIPAKQFKWSSYEQWRELIPGIDWPEDDL